MLRRILSRRFIQSRSALWSGAFRMVSELLNRIRRIRQIRLIPFAVAATASCTGGEKPPAQAAGRLTLAIEGRSNENVSLASLDDFTVAVWSASTSDSTDIFAAVSADGGMSFGTPMRVNAKPGDARAGGEQPPRVTLVPQAGHTPDIVVVWTARGAGGTRLLTATSKYGVNPFGATTVIPGGEAAGNRGWQSLAADAGGKVFALWLDHRNTASNSPAAVHQHGTQSKTPARPAAEQVERAGLSQLWLGSLDGSVAAKGISGGVCYCCKTSLAISGTNTFAVWRHVFPGNQRDIAFAMSRDGGSTFSEIVRVSEDKWQFDGCPENGPALAVGSDDIVHVAWVTPEEGKEGAPLALYRSRTRDGKTFSPRERVKTGGAAAHAQLVAGLDGAIALAWDEATPRGRRVMFTRWRNVSSFPGVAVDTVDGVYPALATSSKGTVVAWVSRGGPKTAIGVTVIP
jgi:hypothetical protein